MEALANCTSLTYLHLGFGNSDVGSTGIIAKALSSLPMLAHLHLNHMQMNKDSVSAQTLAQYLPQYTALKHLDISGNYLLEQGSRALVEVLSECTALVSLDMHSNHFGNAVARELVDTCLRLAAQKAKFDLTVINNNVELDVRHELSQ